MYNVVIIVFISSSDIAYTMSNWKKLNEFKFKKKWNEITVACSCYTNII